MIPWQDTAYYATYDIASPTMSAVTAALVGVAGFVSLVIVAVGVWRQAAVRARAARIAETEAEKRTLAPGYAIVHGDVETGDDLPAVSVRIRQSGKEYADKGGMRHRWTEFERQVDARPFSLRLASGERVKVLPGNDVFLVDVLSSDPIAGTGARPAPLGVPFSPQRVRIAELTSKDSAYACGQLVPPLSATAYRGGEDCYTLHPPPGGKMLLSAEPLEQRYARRARFHGAWAFGLFAVLLVVNAGLLGGYWLELIWGRTVGADVTQMRNWTTSGKHGPIQHYGVNAGVTLPDGYLALSSETNFSFYRYAKAELASGRSLEVPFVVVPFRYKTADIGTRPTLHDVRCFFSWFFLVCFGSAYWVHTRNTRAWYERKKVIDVGRGPLGYPDKLV